jgi:hypothetical protein
MIVSGGYGSVFLLGAGAATAGALLFEACFSTLRKRLASDVQPAEDAEPSVVAGSGSERRQG